MPSRRTLLRTVGAGSLAGLAGCVGNLTSRTPLGDGTTTTTSTPANETNTTQTTTDEPPAETGRFRLSGTEVLEDFEDVSNWSADQGSVEPASDGFQDSAGMRITGPEGREFAWASKSVDWDLSGKTLSLAVKIGKPVSDNLIVSVRLLAPDTNNVFKMGELIRAREGQQWMRLDLGVRNFDGDPSFSDITEVQVGMEAASGAIDFVVDDLRAVPRPETGYVLLTFDDSLESHYTEAFPLLKEYDMPGNVSVITGQVGSEGSLSTDEMTEMQDAGWEFASHATGDASLTSMSSQERWLAMNDANDWLTGKGFAEDSLPFVYPHGDFTADIIDFASKYHSTAYRYMDPLSASTGPITDPMTIGRGNAAYDMTLNKTMVNYAEIFKNLTVFTFHGIGTDGGLSMDPGDLRALIDYISRRNVEVITLSDVEEKLVLG